MMDKYLSELQNLFYVNLVKASEKYIKSVFVVNSYEEGKKIGSHHLPCLGIRPAGDSIEQGPFGNTNRIVYKIELLLLMYSVEYSETQTGTTAENIHAISLKIRELLFANKQLTPNTLEMRDLMPWTDFIWTEGGANISARNVELQYTELEYYTGMVNNQQTLNPITI